MIAHVRSCRARLERAERRAAAQLDVVQAAGTRSPLIADLYVTSNVTVDIASRVREAHADLNDALGALR